MMLTRLATKFLTYLAGFGLQAMGAVALGIWDASLAYGGSVTFALLMTAFGPDITGGRKADMEKTEPSRLPRGQPAALLVLRR